MAVEKAPTIRTLRNAFPNNLNDFWETRDVDLNEKELFGFIQGSEESPVIRRYQAFTMQVALMQYFARNVVVLCYLMQGQLHYADVIRAFFFVFRF